MKTWVFPRWRFAVRLLVLAPTLLLVSLLVVGSFTATESVQNLLPRSDVVVENSVVVSGWGFGAVRKQWEQTAQLWAREDQLCVGSSQNHAVTSSFRSRQCSAYFEAASFSTALSLAPGLVFLLILWILKRRVERLYVDINATIARGKADLIGTFSGTTYPPSHLAVWSNLSLVRWFEVELSTGTVECVAWPVDQRFPDPRSAVAIFRLQGRGPSGQDLKVGVPYMPHVAVIGTKR